jgi:serine/threonine protein kinase
MTRLCPQCATRWPDDLVECPHDGTTLAEPSSEEETGGGSVDLVEAYGCKPGDELGQYRLIRLIGLGGMAAVFEAHHSVIDQPVAMKVLHRELHGSAADVRRFFHEARAITQLKHPGIVECLDFADATPDNPPYLVMELALGTPLSEVIKARAPLPMAETLSIISQICDAMSAVHAQGILHRDLKPSNVMILEPSSADTGQDEPPQVKLLDFGVAKFLVTDEHFLRTATGAVLGTPEYMAPEVVRGQRLSTATDVYALGGVLYELLTGRLPFVCDNLGQLIKHHLHNPAESPSKVAPRAQAEQIPSSLDKLVLSCLAKSPEHRVPDMSELKTRLQRSLAADNTEVVVIPTDLPPLPRRWPRPQWAAVGAVIVAVLALALWWSLRSPDGQSPRAPASPHAPTTTKSAATPPTPEDASSPLVAQEPSTVERPTRLVSLPSGAAVFRRDDGRFLGQTPLDVTLGPATTLRVILRLADYQDRHLELHHRPQTPLVATLVPRSKPTMGSVRPIPSMRPTSGPGRPTMGRPASDVTWGVVDPFKKSK